MGVYNFMCMHMLIILGSENSFIKIKTLYMNNIVKNVPLELLRTLFIRSVFLQVFILSPSTSTSKTQTSESNATLRQIFKFECIQQIV